MTGNTRLSRRGRVRRPGRVRGRGPGSSAGSSPDPAVLFVSAADEAERGPGGDGGLFAGGGVVANSSMRTVRQALVHSSRAAGVAQAAAMAWTTCRGGRAARAGLRASWRVLEGRRRQARRLISGGPGSSAQALSARSWRVSWAGGGRAGRGWPRGPGWARLTRRARRPQRTVVCRLRGRVSMFEVACIDVRSHLHKRRSGRKSSWVVGHDCRWHQNNQDRAGRLVPR